MLDHARGLAAWFGESTGVRMFRKHATWYTKGFRGSARLRREVMAAATLDALESVLARLPADERFPPSAMRVPRGKTAGIQRVALPPGFLDDRLDATPPPAAAEDATSGG